MGGSDEVKPVDPVEIAARMFVGAFGCAAFSASPGSPEAAVINAMTPLEAWGHLVEEDAESAAILVNLARDSLKALPAGAEIADGMIVVRAGAAVQSVRDREREDCIAALRKEAADWQVIADDKSWTRGVRYKSRERAEGIRQAIAKLEAKLK